MPIVSTALQSGSILLREGLEAMLIISALAAFLTRAGVAARVRGLYWGGGLAILASIGAAIVFETFFGGAHDDRVEAIVMLVAAGLMFYMSGWLILKQDPRAWQAELAKAADKAVKFGTMLSLGMIAFLAVFREGGETILFLHALAKTSGGWSLGFWLGLVAAALVLVVLWIAIKAFAMRLPLRPMFLITSGFLFVMAIKFVGGAIQEFQEMQIVEMTPLEMPAWLIDLGANASVEAVIAQVAIALVAVLGTVAGHYRGKAGAQMAKAV